MTKQGFSRLSLIVVLVSLASPNWAAPSDDLPTYRAVYRVERNGKDSGASEWSLTYDAERGVYRFVSSLSAKGALRLALPNPIVERAEFKYENGEIVPMEFWYEDGSRKGDDNFHTVFDWEQGRAVTNAQGGRTELELRAGVLDRASMQVAVMRDMATPEGPGNYRSPMRTRSSSTATSAMGRKPSTLLRALSKRKCLFSNVRDLRAACCFGPRPELAFLPVRMEQQKDGQTDTTLILESVELNGKQVRLY